MADYTFLLMEALRQNGHQCAAISLNERFPFSASCTSDSSLVQKFPEGAHWDEKKEAFDSMVSSFKPDLIILQFVIFGWNRRGLPIRNLPRLASLLKGHPSAIMFHELWTGIFKEESLRRKLLGRIQKHLIGSMIRRISPVLILTNTNLYRSILEAESFKAKRLPLFGNIPVAQSDDTFQLPPELRDNRANSFVVGLFGTIHPDWDGAELISRLGHAAADSNKSLWVILIGRTGSETDSLIREARKRSRTELHFHRTGESTPSQISRWLSSLDVGVSSYPVELIEKSGSALAFSEHGIPVICSRRLTPNHNCKENHFNDQLVLIFSPPGEPLRLDSILGRQTAATSLLPAVVATYSSYVEQTFQRGGHPVS